MGDIEHPWNMFLNIYPGNTLDQEFYTHHFSIEIYRQI